MALKGGDKAQNVLYVKGLKHDLFSVGQMCDADYNLTIYVDGCEIRWNGSRKVIGKGIRDPGNVYILGENQGERF